jgi:hypothetical protein
MGKWIGREAAQWPHLVGMLAVLFTPLLHLTTDQSGALIAVIVGVTGGATAVSVGGEKAAPLVAGLMKAVLAVALAIHLDFSPGAQAAVMVFVEAIVGWYLRTQVVAPVPPIPVVAPPVVTPPVVAAPVTVTPTPDPLPVTVVAEAVHGAHEAPVATGPVPAVGYLDDAPLGPPQGGPLAP